VEEGFVEENTALPEYVEAEPGTFKPVMLCTHDELIDAAIAYMNKAYEYRQSAEALCSLAGLRQPKPGGRSSRATADPAPVTRLHAVPFKKPPDNCA
jgi:hypothetical protein